MSTSGAQAELLLDGAAGDTRAACALGMSERRRRDTDLIVDLHWTSRTVTVEQMDAPSLTLRADTGAASA